MPSWSKQRQHANQESQQLQREVANSQDVMMLVKVDATIQRAEGRARRCVGGSETVSGVYSLVEALVGRSKQLDTVGWGFYSTCQRAHRPGRPKDRGPGAR